MAINFPDSPTIGDEFTGGGFTWTWNGSSWEKVVASSAAGFNIDIGATGNTTFVLDSGQPAGAYFVDSQFGDSTIEFYAIALDGTLSGYTNTPTLKATKEFNRVVVYGGTDNDIITFTFKETLSPSSSGQEDTGAAPFISSISAADLPSINDTTVISGGNFATDVEVTFTGTDSVVRDAKSVVRTDSTQLIVTRPDEMLEDNSPYDLTVLNPGIPTSLYKTSSVSVTAGADPTWTTASGELAFAVTGSAYSTTLQASDPDGGSITYSLVSGQFPAGLSLNQSTGEISGQSTILEESQSFVIAATDPEGNSTNRSFTINTGYAVNGGTVTTDESYRYHTFTSSDTLTLYATTSAEYLVVAGGGGGGYTTSAQGGGGGAGGLLSGTLSINPGSYAITVGAGGGGATTGTDSSIDSLISSSGGGGGANGYGGNGQNGGSGGGANSNGQTGGTAVSGQGNPGGVQAGGGGGAGFAGGSNNGPGGDGLEFSDWAAATGLVFDGGYFAGGGGAAISSAGGLGGGGVGAPSTRSGGGNADANSGGGGGGNRTNWSYSPATTSAGGGGSGVVVVRYPL